MKKSTMRYGLSLLAVGLMGSYTLVGMTRLAFTMDDDAQNKFFTAGVSEPAEKLPATEATNIKTRMTSGKFEEVCLALYTLLQTPASATQAKYHCAELADTYGHPLFIQPIIVDGLRAAYNTPKSLRPAEKKKTLFGIMLAIIEAAIDAGMLIEMPKMPLTTAAEAYKTWRAPLDAYLGYIIPNLTDLNYLSELISIIERKRTSRVAEKAFYYPTWLPAFKEWGIESLHIMWRVYLPARVSMNVTDERACAFWAQQDPDEMVGLRDGLYSAAVLVLQEVKDMAPGKGVDLTDEQNLDTWKSFLSKDLVLEIMQKFRTVKQVKRDVEQRAKK